MAQLKTLDHVHHWHKRGFCPKYLKTINLTDDYRRRWTHSRRARAGTPRCIFLEKRRNFGKSERHDASTQQSYMTQVVTQHESSSSSSSSLITSSISSHSVPCSSDCSCQSCYFQAFPFLPARIVVRLERPIAHHTTSSSSS